MRSTEPIESLLHSPLSSVLRDASLHRQLPPSCFVREIERGDESGIVEQQSEEEVVDDGVVARVPEVREHLRRVVELEKLASCKIENMTRRAQNMSL